MILIDTHTHRHAIFGIEPFLEAALAHMKADGGEADEPHRVLCLAEAHGQRFFRELTSQLGQRVADSWRVCQAPEPVSLRVERESGHSMWFVAGRQIVTSERLEMLCLGRDADLPDRVYCLPELTEKILEAGGLPVLPWGFGKWIGARGRTVKAFLEQDPIHAKCCLGDNGNRPQLWPEPEALGIARAKKLPVLPGSDPLPLASACGDVGRYGLRLDGVLPSTAPWAHLQAQLTNPSTSRSPYGRREALLRFVWNQTRLRLAR